MILVFSDVYIYPIIPNKSGRFQSDYKRGLFANIYIYYIYIHDIPPLSKIFRHHFQTPDFYWFGFRKADVGRITLLVATRETGGSTSHRGIRARPMPKLRPTCARQLPGRGGVFFLAENPGWEMVNFL